MAALLPITVLVASQVTRRLILIVSLIWEERVRAASHRAQMEAAAAYGTLLFACHADGAVLIVIPPTTSREQASAAQSLLR